MMKYLSLLFVLLISLPNSAGAATLEITPVTKDVWAIIGPLEQRSPENLGNNATFGVVATNEGVVLIDPGGSYKGAQEIHKLIRGVSDKPVKVVINTGGQDHRWLGNGYFKERGAKIIASSAAVEDQKSRGSQQLSGLAILIGEEGLEGTLDVYADVTFNEAHDFMLGGIKFQLKHVAPAHTPGDAFVWLPGKNVLFSGDIIYVKRMLGVGPMSSSRTWPDVFMEIEALKPKYIVPGHGPVSDLATATRDTRDYLAFLRREIGQVIDAGGDINEATAINQSAFSYLEVFEQIKGRNAQQVFEQMEWE